MTRRMSTTRRVRIFTAHDGRCHLCGCVIDGVREPWDVDHIVPYALSGDDGDANLAPAHAACHRGTGSKTSDDVRTIARSKRVAARHMGAKAPTRSPLPGSKASRFKRRIDGTTVLRQDRERP